MLVGYHRSDVFVWGWTALLKLSIVMESSTVETPLYRSIMVYN